ncbi:inositol monophosphatase [Eubacteriales bacterium OttesenSCG-928-K08]|nr:inositol monophosphatase [Eubacteriales bacterium OttesenSCG-928-K08]
MLNRIIACVREAGKIMLDARDIAQSTQNKQGIGNFVTDYDIAVQNALGDSLRRILPASRIIGEEDDGHSGDLSGDCFIIDPIDGTANFIRGYQHSAISVALLKDGRPQAGVVYNPYLNELFSAELGKGAFCNGRPISVSERTMPEAIFLFGASSYSRETTDKNFRIVRALFDNTADCRSSGSAALDICYVAAGRCELFFEMTLSPWDYAAGGLILSEAGGIATDMLGKPLSYTHECSVLASSLSLHEQAVGIVKQAL